MEKNSIWQIRKPPASGQIDGLGSYPTLFQSLLLTRGLANIDDVQSFIDPGPPTLYDPFLLKGMVEAVEVIQAAHEQGSTICIYADYDADGITSASLLSLFFDELDLEARVYFPDRFREGYGLNIDAIERLCADGVGLLITVDCGIRSVQEVEKARDLGMDVIITDHHLPGDVLPESTVTINPRQPGDRYPDKELAGVGLAYKLAQAIAASWTGEHNVDDFLDLVAIGTVADMVSLLGENRNFVRHGIQRINQGARPGLSALINVSGIQPGTVDASSIGFRLAPRINASGRLSSARHAYELLIEQDQERAQVLAEKLDRLNKERQKLTRAVVTRLDEHPPNASDRIILSFDPEYHQGVVGLAASRIVDRYYRPAIIGTTGATETRASARSIPGFNITEALEQLAPYLKRYGGHAAAAGLTVENGNREIFIDKLLELVDRSISADMLQPVVVIDAKIEFGQVDPGMMSFLELLAPFGSDNRQPLFCAGGVNVLAKRAVGRDGSHLKLTIENHGRPFDAIAFGKGELSAALPSRIEAAFHVERNNYLGYDSLQLRITDIRPEGQMDRPDVTRWVDWD